MLESLNFFISSYFSILSHPLPRAINSKAAKAAWDPQRHHLTITAPLLPGEYDFLRQ